SDVPGDALGTIGSGPTVADPSTFAQALAALRATDPTGAAVPARIWRHLEAGSKGNGPAETPKAADLRLERSLVAVLGTNRTALAAAARAARRYGYGVVGPPGTLEGEAAECGRALAAALPPLPQRPLCVLAGGETHVNVGRARGKGGRC